MSRISELATLEMTNWVRKGLTYLSWLGMIYLIWQAVVPHAAR